MFCTRSGLLFGWQLLSKPLRCSIDGPDMLSSSWPPGRPQPTCVPRGSDQHSATGPRSGTAQRVTDGATASSMPATLPTTMTKIQRYFSKGEFLRQQAKYLEEMPKEPIGLQPQENRTSLDGMTVSSRALMVSRLHLTEELLSGCRVRAIVRSQRTRAVRPVMRRRRGVAPGRDRGALDLAGHVGAVLCSTHQLLMHGHEKRLNAGHVRRKIREAHALWSEPIRRRARAIAEARGPVRGFGNERTARASCLGRTP